MEYFFMIPNGSFESSLHDVKNINVPWGCVDRRKGFGLHYGIAGGVDGLAQDLDAAIALQSSNTTPEHHDATHIRAKLLCKQLGNIGITIVNHHACAAIDNRQTIADTIINRPDMVYDVAQSIDSSVTESQVELLGEYYTHLRSSGKLVDPNTAKREMMAPCEFPAIDTVPLEDSRYDITDGFFIINDIEGVAMERNGRDYEFSLAAVRCLERALRQDELYPVTRLAQASSIRAAAVKLVLPGGTEAAPGPELIRLAA